MDMTVQGVKVQVNLHQIHAKILDFELSISANHENVNYQ